LHHQTTKKKFLEMITETEAATELSACDQLQFECRAHLDPFTDRLRTHIRAWEGETKAVQAFEMAVYAALKKLLEAQNEGCLEDLIKE
jgi:hypothetical protein